MNIKIDTTLERDIDLLILEEFISNPEFASIFLKAVGISDAYTIGTAIHSKMDAELGESDIVFVLNINGKRHALHIEDKIDAPTMSKQSERYYIRGNDGKKRGEYEKFYVFLVCPHIGLHIHGCPLILHRKEDLQPEN